MSPGEKVKAKLAADAAVIAIVEDRIYPNVLPAEVQLPALVYFVVDSVPQSSMDGVASGALANARVQVDMYSRDYDEVHDLAEKVTDVVDAERVSFTAWEIDTRDLWDVELQAHRVSRDFAIWAGR